MAGGTLLTLLDDIASVLDDVAAMTKVAAKKTAGVLGDDLALNAEQVSGVKADRELPVIWAVAKGSFLNKLILVPSALAISYFIPWLIMPLLMVGGAYLCFEGFEKVFHKLFHRHDSEDSPKEEFSENPKEREKEKIKGAIRTDFILSAEIVVIALGTVSKSSFAIQAGVVTTIAFGITVFVYGLVAGIVKLDDLGLYLVKEDENREGFIKKIKRGIGNAILSLAPWLMKTLAFVGTAAMFLVGGGILLHGIPKMHHFIHHAQLKISTVSGVGSILSAALPTVANFIAGIIAGGLLVLIYSLVTRIFSKRRKQHS